MEKKELSLYLKKYFHAHGFEKIKGRYYRNGNGFLCEIHPFKSYYGEIYYVHYHFFIGDFQKPYVINRESVPTYTPCVSDRFRFTEDDGCDCQYIHYDCDQMKIVLDKNMSLRILPPFQEGKKYLLDNFGKLYWTFANRQEEILQLLSE